MRISVPVVEEFEATLGNNYLTQGITRKTPVQGCAGYFS
jgi:hypothetical protein